MKKNLKKTIKEIDDQIFCITKHGNTKISSIIMNQVTYEYFKIIKGIEVVDIVDLAIELLTNKDSYKIATYKNANIYISNLVEDGEFLILHKSE